MKALFLLLFIPQLAAWSMNVFTDIYVDGQPIRRIQLTADPTMTVERFKVYLFLHQGISRIYYDLYRDGKALRSSDRLGDFNDFANTPLQFSVEKLPKPVSLEVCPCLVNPTK